MKKTSRVKTVEDEITLNNNKDDVKDIIQYSKTYDWSHVSVPMKNDCCVGSGVTTKKLARVRSPVPYVGEKNKSEYNVVYHNHPPLLPPMHGKRKFNEESMEPTDRPHVSDM